MPACSAADRNCIQPLSSSGFKVTVTNCKDDAAVIGKLTRRVRCWKAGEVARNQLSQFCESLQHQDGEFQRKMFSEKVKKPECLKQTVLSYPAWKSDKKWSHLCNTSVNQSSKRISNNWTCATDGPSTSSSFSALNVSMSMAAAHTAQHTHVHASQKKSGQKKRCPIQRSAKRLVRRCEKFITALA